MSGEVSCPIDEPIDDYQCNLTGMCKVGLLIMLNANMEDKNHFFEYMACLKAKAWSYDKIVISQSSVGCATNDLRLFYQSSRDFRIVMRHF